MCRRACGSQPPVCCAHATLLYAHSPAGSTGCAAWAEGRLAPPRRLSCAAIPRQGVDADTVVFVADPNTGNILNFNVGENVDFKVPRVSKGNAGAASTVATQVLRMLGHAQRCWGGQPAAPNASVKVLQGRTPRQRADFSPSCPDGRWGAGGRPLPCPRPRAARSSACRTDPRGCCPDCSAAELLEPAGWAVRHQGEHVLQLEVMRSAYARPRPPAQAQHPPNTPGARASQPPFTSASSAARQPCLTPAALPAPRAAAVLLAGEWAGREHRQRGGGH